MRNLSPYRSIAVANWFIENLRTITPLKLQKLIYFAHGWHLAIRDAPLIDELVEAWKYGPVIPNVYHEFKIFGNQPITDFGTEWEPTDKREILVVRPRIADEAKNVKALLAKIVDEYGNYTAAQLSTMTHEPNSPWDKIRKQYPDRHGVDIPDEMIKEHFKRLANPS